MSRGYLAFVLHAHLPFVRHPEYDSFLEERWLFEAITETYIPLIQFFDGCVKERVPFQVTVSVSPSLLAMLEDEMLQARYADHLERLIRLCDAELERTQHEGHFRWLAGMYRDLFAGSLELFEGCGRRLSKRLLALHQSGAVELITTSATHGILPLLAVQPRAVEAQLATGIDYFESVFGFTPKGMWLPECAYLPGLDEALRRRGIRYFITESHAIEHASTAPFHGVHTPIFTPSGVAAFGRDQHSLKEVWSADDGFPGDPDYREFYRDIGHDLEAGYIHHHMGGDVRSDTGIKYFRITGRTPHKEAYNPDAAREKAALHAGIFVDKRVAHIEYLAAGMERAPIVLAPFDAELFGHWWFEGPQWLNFVIRKFGYDQDSVELTTPSRYLDSHPVHQVGQPSMSTWGHAGYFDTWLSPKVDWIYDHLVECARRMEALVDGPGELATGAAPSPTVKRALDQALRELLLAQSSDWPFIISNGTSTQYAERRVRDHVTRFHALADAIEAHHAGGAAIDEALLKLLEFADNAFPDADYRVFAEPRRGG